VLRTDSSQNDSHLRRSPYNRSFSFSSSLRDAIRVKSKSQNYRRLDTTTAEATSTPCRGRHEEQLDEDDGAHPGRRATTGPPCIGPHDTSNGDGKDPVEMYRHSRRPSPWLPCASYATAPVLALGHHRFWFPSSALPSNHAASAHWPTLNNHQQGTAHHKSSSSPETGHTHNGSGNNNNNIINNKNSKNNTEPASSLVLGPLVDTSRNSSLGCCGPGLFATSTTTTTDQRYDNGHDTSGSGRRFSPITIRPYDDDDDSVSKVTTSCRVRRRVRPVAASTNNAMTMMVDANNNDLRPLPAAVNGKHEQRQQEEAMAQQAMAYMDGHSAGAMWQQQHDARSGVAGGWCGSPDARTFLHHLRRPLATATYAETTTTMVSCNSVYFDEKSSSSTGTEPKTTIPSPDDATSGDPVLARNSSTEFDRRLARAMDDVLAPADSDALRIFSEHRLQTRANNFSTGMLVMPTNNHRHQSVDAPNLDHHSRKTWP
jgi:hypothetical protein